MPEACLQRVTDLRLVREEPVGEIDDGESENAQTRPSAPLHGTIQCFCAFLRIATLFRRH